MEMKKPTAEHEWLKKFEGNWISEGEIMMEPGKPPIKTAGTESTRSLGPFWIITEMTSAKVEGQDASAGGCCDNFTGIFQLGYDTRSSQFIGSFIDTMGTHMWKYTGQFNESHTAAVLNTQGFGPDDKPLTVRETLELVSDNERRFTSEFKMEDGSWFKVVDIRARRK